MNIQKKTPFSELKNLVKQKYLIWLNYTFILYQIENKKGLCSFKITDLK